MKRSASVTLSATFLAALSLAGCESGFETGGTMETDDVGTLFTSREACREVYSAAECDTHAETARKVHGEEAPKFETAAKCEAEFGTCQPANHNGIVSFTPALIGFLVGQESGRLSARPVHAKAGDCDDSACRRHGATMVFTGSHYVGTTPAYLPGGSNSGPVAVKWTKASEFQRGSFGGVMKATGTLSSPKAFARGGFGGSSVRFTSVGG